MSTDTPSMEDTGYLGSKGKVLFRRAIWIIVLFIVLSLIGRAVNSLIAHTTELGADSTAAMVLSCILKVLPVAGWLLILLPYGLYNRVKAFKIMYFIVAGTNFIAACIRIISEYTQELFASGVYTIVPAAVWIAFMVVILCHPKTGRSLKKASILMLIGQILIIAYLPVAQPLFQSLIQNLGNAKLGLMVLGFFVIVALFYCASQIYFLWAMAVSEMKKDTVDNATEQTT